MTAAIHYEDDDRWAQCIKQGVIRFGFGLILGGALSFALVSETPLFVGTGLGSIWAVANCKKQLSGSSSGRKHRSDEFLPEVHSSLKKRLYAVLPEWIATTESKKDFLNASTMKTHNFLVTKNSQHSKKTCTCDDIDEVDDEVMFGHDGEGDAGEGDDYEDDSPDFGNADCTCGTNNSNKYEQEDRSPCFPSESAEGDSVYFGIPMEPFEDDAVCTCDD